MSFKSPIKDVRAIRIEVSSHSSLPNDGPGLTNYEGPIGGFFLSELQAFQDDRRVKITSADATNDEEEDRINDQAAIKRINEAKKVDLVVKVTGRQWVWQFKYPDGNFTVNETLVVPANKTVRLDLTTVDVIHAWWIPAMGGMIYVNPGELSYVWFNAEPGEYFGQCNVFCGLAHAQMVAKVKVLPQADYDKWLAEQKTASGSPAGAGDVARGQQVFMSGSCVSCHTIDGTNAKGIVAPRPLTHFATYEQVAQAIPNTADNVTKWLTNPQDIKPGTKMPNLNLKPQEIADLTAYLETLK